MPLLMLPLKLKLLPPLFVLLPKLLSMLFSLPRLLPPLRFKRNNRLTLNIMSVTKTRPIQNLARLNLCLPLPLYLRWHMRLVLAESHS
jgi:hypothetical protein